MRSLQELYSLLKQNYKQENILQCIVHCDYKGIITNEEATRLKIDYGNNIKKDLETLIKQNKL